MRNKERREKGELIEGKRIDSRSTKREFEEGDEGGDEKVLEIKADK